MMHSSIVAGFWPAKLTIPSPKPPELAMPRRLGSSRQQKYSHVTVSSCLGPICGRIFWWALQRRLHNCSFRRGGRTGRHARGVEWAGVCRREQPTPPPAMMKNIAMPQRRAAKTTAATNRSNFLNARALQLPTTMPAAVARRSKSSKAGANFLQHVHEAGHSSDQILRFNASQ